MSARRVLALLAALAVALMPVALAAVLEVGSRGGDVTAVQKKLIQWGYLTGAADGRYGEKTRQAVIAFQRRNGLDADGIVGAETRAVLFSAGAKPAAAEVPEAVPTTDTP
jgi:N-acetylmuramoyl-L-alanine amidase